MENLYTLRPQRHPTVDAGSRALRNQGPCSTWTTHDFTLLDRKWSGNKICQLKTPVEYLDPDECLIGCNSRWPHNSHFSFMSIPIKRWKFMSDSSLTSKKKMIVLKVVIDTVFYLYKKLLLALKIWMIVNINLLQCSSRYDMWIS